MGRAQIRSTEQGWTVGAITTRRRCEMRGNEWLTKEIADIVWSESCACLDAGLRTQNAGLRTQGSGLWQRRVLVLTGPRMAARRSQDDWPHSLGYMPYTSMPSARRKFKYTRIYTRAQPETRTHTHAHTHANNGRCPAVSGIFPYFRFLFPAHHLILPAGCTVSNYASTAVGNEGAAIHVQECKMWL